LTHNESNTAHSDIRTSVTNAITHLEEYVDTAEEDAKEYADAQITAHNIDENAHGDIRDTIAGLGTTTQTMIDNSIALHNIDEDAHPYIVSDAENYADNAISTHNSDPEAHGGKQVLYTTLIPNNGVYSSSMSYLDIQTAFSDDKGVNAIIINGGEFPLSITNNSVVGTRTSMEGNELLYETYLMNPNNNTFTRIVNRYTLNPAPPRTDEAVADYSIVVDPESKSNDAIIGSAVIGVSTIGNDSSSGGGGDDPLYVEFTPASTSTEDDMEFTCNVSADQIVTALNNKRRVISVLGDDGAYSELQVNQYGMNGDVPRVKFNMSMANGTTNITYMEIIMMGDTISSKQLLISAESTG